MANATVRVISGNFLTARPVGIVDGVDFGHSGLVRKVDAPAMRRAIETGAVVLLSTFIDHIEHLTHRQVRCTVGA